MSRWRWVLGIFGRRTLAFSAILLGIGCQKASDPTCGNGILERGEVCDDGNEVDTDLCTNQCQKAVCGDGIVQSLNGEECDRYSVEGVPCRATCRLTACGDGILDVGEMCDDGNSIDGDRCTSTCQIAQCGDGIVFSGVESCDDGNTIDDDGCHNNCRLGTCGDGVVDPGEACDDGNDNDEDGCLNTCILNRCGDGVQNRGVEACDDGNLNNGDECTNSCAVARCGDGYVRASVEECDDGNAVNEDTCSNACERARCGDGIVQAGEDCDDGNRNDADSCSNGCVTARCGDGIVQIGLEDGDEVCDDANADDGDSCLSGCQVARCGDGIVWFGVEACDDGNTVDTDDCRNDCRRSTCGDGIVQIGEACDDGNQIENDGCTSRCLPPRCGDALIQSGESCDDGNMVTFDNCVNCQPARCGDGYLHLGVEECDDGNDVNDDDCSNTCRLPFCGDGILQADEECDDGNRDNGDGCLNNCVSASCGDGIVHRGVERCDDGNRDDYDECRTNCENARCGDGVVWAGRESCDDGNLDNGDECTNLCQRPACGDGFRQAGEACDDANGNDNDGCLSSCTVAVCGDGIVRAGVEACDDGNRNDDDGCRNDCRLPTCGDGIRQRGEECDDGNGEDGDECTNRCLRARCGDGLVQLGVEACDDGNLANDDACVDECRLAVCGDGHTQLGVEGCDDANDSNSDGCLNHCVTAYCGDGIVHEGVEQCDDANRDNTDGCLAGCIAFDFCGENEVMSAEPTSVCEGRVPQRLRLTTAGTGFIFVDGMAPNVQIAGISRSIVGQFECEPLYGALVEARRCRSIEVDLPTDLVVGRYEVHVRMPTTQTCELSTYFSVGYPAILQSLDPVTVCEGDDSVGVIGQNFIEETMVFINEQESASVEFVDPTYLKASLPPLEPGVYDVAVENGQDCGSFMEQALTVAPKPIPYYVDPPVIYSGVNMDITIFVAGVNGGGIDKVVIRRSDGSGQDISLPVDFDPLRNRAYASVPAGLTAPDESVLFDVIITDSIGCQARMTEGFRATGEASVVLREIRPRFGWTNSNTDISIFAEPALAQAIVPPFVSVPRVYLAASNADEGVTGKAVNAIAMSREDLLTGRVRAGFDPGVYDLIVINPDGRIGVLEKAFGVSLIPPPLIDDVAPGSVPSQPDQRVVVFGRFTLGKGVLGGGGFLEGGGGVDLGGGGSGTGGAGTGTLDDDRPTVQLRCKDPNGVVSIHQTVLTLFATNKLEVLVPADEITNNSVCVVRVTQANATWAEFSAIGVTNPAENIAASKVFPAMGEVRRMPSVTTLDATRAARYLLAIGGDAGDFGTASDTIEQSSLDEFGGLSSFRYLRRKLPRPRTDSPAVAVEREYVYLVGGRVQEPGAVEATATSSVLRAQILQPDDSPVMTATDIDLVDDAVGPGVWYYKVAAVMDQTHPINPNGETLPSEALPVSVPARIGKDFLVTVKWQPVAGAAAYRIYRTLNPNQTPDSVVHVATVPSGLARWTDDDTERGDGQTPLPQGELGVWVPMPNLPVALAGTRVSVATDPENQSKKYLYAVGGRTLTEVSNVVYRLDLVEGPFGLVPSGNWSVVGEPLGEGRADHVVYKVDEIATTRVDGGETWIFVGPGKTSTQTGESDSRLLESAVVLPSGDLGPWFVVTNRAPDRSGYGGVAAANQLFMFGGSRGDASDDSVSAQLCGIDGPCPDKGDARNFNGTAAPMAQPRKHMGLTVGSAHIFLIGGMSDTAAATNTVEGTIW